MKKSKHMKPIIITAQERFEVEKPRYNPYQTGHGAHGSGKAYKRHPKHKGQEY